MVKRELAHGTLTLTLNRPEKANSYDGAMVRALTAELRSLTGVRLVVLRGAGKNFCGGADLDWMAQGGCLSDAENVQDMRCILEMYQTLLSVTQPILVYVQGKVRGGGLGLVSCADYAIAEDAADFALSEVRWGLVPGIITPLLERRLGVPAVEELAQGRVFGAPGALALGLIQQVGGDAPSVPVERWTSAKPSAAEWPGLLRRMEECLLESAMRRKQLKRPV